MGMITPWDSLGVGSKLHVATDLDVIHTLRLFSTSLTADQKPTWQDTHPRHIDITVDLFHGHDNTLGQSWDG